MCERDETLQYAFSEYLLSRRSLKEKYEFSFFVLFYFRSLRSRHFQMTSVYFFSNKG